MPPSQSASQMVTLNHPPSGVRVDVPADAVIAAMGAELTRLRGVDEELRTLKQVALDDAAWIGRLRTTALEVADAIERTPIPDNAKACADALREVADGR